MSRLSAWWYGAGHPFYDLMTAWAFLPLGGEAHCRRRFAAWLEVEPGQRVLSLCCGTGTTDRAIAELVPGCHITGIDLGRGQLAVARRRDRDGRIDYRRGDASATGLEDGRFDRVLVALALHEMQRPQRLAVLREARRLCCARGRVLVIEHAPLDRHAAKLARWLCWFGWLPFNPETATTRDLQRRGLANEMREAGLLVARRHVTDPPWIEAIEALPRPAE